MKKNRILSALLCLSLAAGLVIPGLPAYAEGEGESGSNSGMKLNKTAVANKNGTYTIMLEAYATGAKVISEITKDVPTDIILVLDQSGSMANDIGTVSFEQYEDETDWLGNVSTYHTRNQDYYKYRHNGGSGNLWHKLEDDSYVSVSVKKSPEYTPLPESFVNYETSWGSISKNCYFYYANNLYEKVGDEYKKVELSENKSGDWYNPTYTYTFSDGTSISSTGRDSKPNLGSHAPLYTPAADGDSTVYTYTYTDSNGIHTIGTSIGANKKFTPAFYQRSTTTSGGGSRLDALKSAATSFANQVATKANGTDGYAGTDDDVKHRIAVVGYAGSSSNLTNGFKQMNNTSQAADVSSAIDNLTANGGTHIDQGLSTANGIFANNPIGDTENRNRVVIVFTDGAPGSYGDWCSESVQTANNAIAYAKTAKKPTSEGGYGATVYTIGIFSGADASNPDSLPAYTSYTTGWFGSEQSPSEADQVKNSNRFMHLVSSNYPAASSITQPGSINPNLNGKSYYLSAADSGALNSIFQQIADNIESGGSSTTLDSSAVIRDIIAPQFELPANATTESIKLYTAESNGSVNSWKTRETFAGSVSLGANDNSVSVSGFSFKDNWCGNQTINGQETFHDGKKLIIEFTVQPKAGFLGGNDVYTNSNAGVYADANATDPVVTFPRPQVNVPIKDVTVTAEDKDVYLLAEVAASELKNGATVKVGDVPLDLSKAGDADKPYGLEKWQTEYVDITVQIKDKDGKVVSTDLSDLKDDTTYTITVTVAPKTKGEGADKGTPATEQSGNGTGNINVYKPELTYKDSEVFYGDNLPTNFDTNNRTATEWKHNGTKANTATMGPAPDLAITYTPEADKTTGNKINSKDDIQVKATVKIKDTDVTANTIFAHTACAEGVTCSWNVAAPNGDPAFLLHVKTATLKITKAGNVGATEGFIFNVSGPQNFRVSVQGNGSVTITGLPLGTYTVTEDEGWSWRYTATGSAKAELTKAKPDGAVTIQNEKDNPYLLDGNDYKQNNFALLSAGN